MNVLCNDMEEIGFRDGEQRRAKPSGTRLIDLVRVMLPLMRSDSFECFLRPAGVRRFSGSAEASSSPTHSAASCAVCLPLRTDVPHILLFSSNLHIHLVRQGCRLVSAAFGIRLGLEPNQKCCCIECKLNQHVGKVQWLLMLTLLAPTLGPKFRLPLCPVGRLLAPLSLRAED